MDDVVRAFLENEQQLRPVKRLGVGGFAEAWEVESPSSVRSAVKVSLQPLDGKNPALQKELDNLKLVKAITGHPHIVSLLDYWVATGYLVTRWELASGGDLLGLWERYRDQGQPGIPVQELIQLMQDAADGLDFLHGRGIYHRDVKPQNLLLFQGRVKVGDLGLAKLVGASTASHTGSGTLGYLPLEALEDHRLTPSVDLYSLAATYLKLRAGFEPFGNNWVEVLRRQRGGEPILEGLNETEKPLLLAALHPDPARRFSGGAQAWVRQLWTAIRQPAAPRGVVMERTSPSPSPEKKESAPPVPELRGVSLALAIAPFDERAARAFQQAWASHLGIPALAENSIGMKLVLIPPGEFMMGSPDSDDMAFGDEKPQHRVRIFRPFYLGVTEVTQEQYKQVMGKNPSDFQGNPKRPVECVSWIDAAEFCRRLSQKEGKEYRLPTEAEWEYACRAGSTTRWCFGDSESELGQYAWFNNNSGDTTHPVGQKEPNAWGLYDMHGNVWEWCADWYDEKYYRASPADDPKGPDSGTSRVLRGGSWVNYPRNTRSAFRLRNHPEFRVDFNGFRVARTL